MHDDMQAMRLLQLEKCFTDGQFPCRWVPDMGYGYGYPQFNFYSPGPYYLMLFFRLFGFGFLACVKIGFALSFLLSALAMFLLGRFFWGDWGGYLAAVFYLYAPYRAMDVYNRGAMAEAWAFVFLPLIFYFLARLSQKIVFKDVAWLAFSLAGLLLSHNVTSLIALPFIGLWLVFCWWFFAVGRRKTFLRLSVLGLFWGFALSAFFLLPAVLEKKYAHTETMLMGYFNYLAHYVSLRQLFADFHWGYGSSVLGPNEDVNFSLGPLHWLFVLPGLAAAWWWAKNKKERLSLIFLAAFFGLMLFVSLFLSHQVSTPFWQKITPLVYLQFPWRFLVLAVFALAFLSGAAFKFLPNVKKPILATALIVFLLFSQVSFFRPRFWFPLTDQEKFSGELWEKQLTISIFDYLPIFAAFPPAEKAPDRPWAVEGKIDLFDFQKGTDWQTGRLSVADSSALVRLPLYYFPGWQVKVDGQIVNLDYQNELGLITFSVPAGEHNFSARLKNTWPRSLGSLLSFAGWFAWLGFWMIKWRQKS